MEALMLQLPRIGDDGMAKLAEVSALAKGGDAWEDEPRVPAGQSGGGQWTTGGSGGSTSPSQTRPQSSGKPSSGSVAPTASRGGASDKSDEIPEIVVPAPVAQSRRQSANGFFVNSTGAGVFFIPTTAGGTQVRPTEIHAEDASAFQVSWDENGVISLKDAKGAIIKVPTAPDELRNFNATTGRALGITIYTFPGTPLASPESPPSPEEERDLAEARAAWLAGRQASEQSWSGRVTTGAVLATAALPAIALLPAAAEAPIAGPLNTAEELWPESEEVEVSGNRAIGQARSYEAGVRGQYPETTMKDRVFTTVVNGERVTGIPDTVAEIHEENTAVESKFVANWARSIRNPASRAGKTAWGRKAQEAMVAQARKYAANFKGGVVYHTNSRELAAYYYRVFRAAGITKFRFIITPVGK
jgi:hypothetical protein